MEQKMDELIKSINNLSGFSWSDLISLIALIGSWITIFLLLKEKYENNRPYLQISFELVRSNLTCDERDRKYLNENKINKLTIFPGKEWIVCLGVIVPDILNNFDKKLLSVDYEYKKLNGIRKYKENTEIDFEQYSRFLVYISEIDELMQVNKKIESNTKNLEKRLKNIETSIVQYHNIQDTFINTIVNGYKEKD